MRYRHIFMAFFIIILPLCGNLRALPTTAQDAERVVEGWLRADSQPLETSLGRRVTRVETFTNDEDEPMYYVVYLDPSGFVIVAADDQVEPIIGFSDYGTYDPAPEHPLGALVTTDVHGRIAAVRHSFGPLAATSRNVETNACKKWSDLMSLAAASDNEVDLMDMSPIVNGHPSDLRVPPILTSLWGQTCCDGPDGQPRACYNYYTPKVEGYINFTEDDPENYPCGCVATTMAQIMQYHRHPKEPVEPQEFTIIIDQFETNRSLIRGRGPDGAYLWENMVDVPGPGTTDEQRRAIGALCHDAGVAVGMQYTVDGSGAYLYDAAAALIHTFKYEKVMWVEQAGNIDWRRDLVDMMNPNLDADLPVFLAIRDSERPWRGHSVVCDGYGYQLSTSYYHLNMGWDGRENCWYNLPDVNCPAAAGYDVIEQCIYNIFPESTGEIISGRIIDSQGDPFSGVTVTVTSESGTDEHTAVTNGRGIYAFKGVRSNTTYFITASKPGYDFELNAGYDSEQNTVTTGRSVPDRFDAGNRWGVNFVGYGNGGGQSRVVSGDIKLVASDAARNDHFGYSVSISDDYAIVGAYGDDSNRGAAYIFKREGNLWIQQAKVRAPFTQRERDGYFGSSVSISDDYAVVGSGNVDCGESNKRIGTFAANVFKRDGTSWIDHSELGCIYSRGFGCSVSIDGDYAAVGGDNSYIFKRSDIGWIQQTVLGTGEVVSIRGDYFITATAIHGYRGEDYYGPAYIYHREDVNWIQQANFNKTRQLFGRSLSINNDYAIIGAPECSDKAINAGAVYVFQRSGSNWTQQTKLTALDGLQDDHFGHSVSISGDFIIVGAPESDDECLGEDCGSAYIFKNGPEGWTQQARLIALDGAYTDAFGSSVSIDGDYAIIGAPANDANGRDSGAAYIFKRIGNTWSP